MQPSPTELLHRELSRLLSHLGRASRPAPGSLGQGEHLVLTALDRLGPTRARDLACSEGLDASTVSRRLAQMEERGYVERVPDPADRRAGLVRVTDAGRSAFEAERRRRAGLVTDLVGEWDAADVALLARLVARLNAAFEGTEES